MRRYLLMLLGLIIITILLVVSPFLLAAPAQRNNVQHDIASLPAGNRRFDDPTDPTLPESRMLIDLDIADQGQTVIADPGEVLSATCEYQIWSAVGNPSEINQGFFIMSWTPGWPPSSEYYIAVWNGISGEYPGVTNTASFSFTAPSTPGTYYLYWCGEAHYSIPQAVNNYDQDLGVPGTPAHAKIVVNAPAPDVTVSNVQRKEHFSLWAECEIVGFLGVFDNEHAGLHSFPGFFFTSQPVSQPTKLVVVR